MMRSLPIRRLCALAVMIAGLEILWNLLYGRLPIYLFSPILPLLAAPLNALVHIGVTAGVFCLVGLIYFLIPLSFFKKYCVPLTAATFAGYMGTTVLLRYLALKHELPVFWNNTFVVLVILAMLVATMLLNHWLELRNRRGAGAAWPALLVLSAFIGLYSLFLRYPLHPPRFFAPIIALVTGSHLAAWLFLHKRRPSLPRLVAWVAVLAILAAAGRGLWSGVGAKGSSRPHLVFIVLDAARSDRMSLHGYGVDTTPFITSAAASGSLVFDQAYSNSSSSYPSHVSILTGLYNRAHGIWLGTDFEIERYDGLETLAGALQQRGYRTLLLTENPWIVGLNSGFEFYNCLEISGTPVSGWNASAVLSATPSAFPPFPGNCPSPFAARQLLDHLRFWFSGYYRPVVDDYELRVLREQMVLRRRDQPLFFFINWMNVHNRYYPAPFRAQGKTIRPYNWSWDYDLALLHIDRRFRDLWSIFAEQKELENTVFVISSDHGELLGEYGVFGHTRFYFQGAVHVPLVFINSNWRGKQTVDMPVSLVAVKPALELLADRFTPSFPRDELVAVFDGKPVVAENRSIQPGPTGDHYLGWMIISPDKNKLVYDQEARTYGSTWGETENFLFDLEKDPKEEVNLYLSHPEIVGELEGLYRDWKEATPAAPPIEAGPIDLELKKTLRKIGYLVD